MNTPSNRTLTCVVCGDPIREDHGETPVIIPEGDREGYGEYDGEAYHIESCEDGIFEEVYIEV